jgi:hypothetical protein
MALATHMPTSSMPDYQNFDDAHNRDWPESSPPSSNISIFSGSAWAPMNHR